MDKMRNRAAFQAQLASIMEALAKAAETEITKLVEDGSLELRLEVSRSHKETEWLRKKLQQVESELRTAQEAATRKSRSVGVQVVGQFVIGGAVKEGEDAPFVQHLNEKKCIAQTRDARPDFGFSVKDEQEEEHVAQVLHQTEYEPSAGRLNNVGSMYVRFERESQLWSSFIHRDSDDPVCSNATEQCSQSQSIILPIQHTPATMRMSGSTLSSLEKDGHVVDGGVLKEEAGGQCLYTEESRSETGGTQQREHKQPPLSTNDDLTSRVIYPVQQQLGLQMGVTEDSMDPVSSSNQNARISRIPDVREKPYDCSLCQKRFNRFFHLQRHQRVHTGEKPFSCAQCGKRFSLKFNLITHERVHTGNKPFGCVHCGKRFAQGSNLRVHNRIHTGERPYHCTQCGNSFTHLRGLKTHWKTHGRNEILGFGINCT